MRRKRVSVLISGRGSNMASLLEACRADDYPAEIVQVISNRTDARGLKTAEDSAIEATAIDHTAFEDREHFDTAVTQALEAARTDIVCLAGFMRLLTREFVSHWYNRLINIHPSLLPAFKGLDTHERALASGVRITGCSVHFVRTEMDTGPVIAQAAVPIRADDTPDSLAERVLEAEHVLYPHALRLVAGEQVRVSGERIVSQGAPDMPAAYFVPPLDN